MIPTKPHILFANVMGLGYNKNVSYPDPILSWKILISLYHSYLFTYLLTYLTTDELTNGLTDRPIGW